MAAFLNNGTALHYRFSAGSGTPIVFLNSLGTDLRIWDDVIADLAPDAPVLCIDKRGHGLSDDADITMDLLIGDVVALMDHLSLPPALICGVSVGGIIAQGMPPSHVAGRVLCCTGMKIGDADGWNARIDAVHSDGLSSMVDAVMERWFSPNYTADLPIYRNMLTRTSPAGYAGVCGAIRDTDFNGLTVTGPAHCIAGANDLATPPALVKTLADQIGATYQVIDNCGHLPCIEAPTLVAQAIRDMQIRIAQSA